MQKSQTITPDKLFELCHAIFKESAKVLENTATTNCLPKEFFTADKFVSHIKQEIAAKKIFSHFAIYYPEAKGYYFIDKTVLNTEPKGIECRYEPAGWGLIQLQIDFNDGLNIDVRITVNSLKRAEAWEATYPKFGEAKAWDWKYVERQTRRLIILIK